MFWVTLFQKHALAQEIQLGHQTIFLVKGWDLKMRLKVSTLLWCAWLVAAYRHCQHSWQVVQPMLVFMLRFMKIVCTYMYIKMLASQMQPVVRPVLQICMISHLHLIVAWQYWNSRQVNYCCKNTKYILQRIIIMVRTFCTHGFKRS